MSEKNINDLQIAYDHFVGVYTYSELSASGYAEKGQDALSKLTDYLRIARIEFNLTAPPNPMSPEGETHFNILYHSGKSSENSPSVIQEFRTDEGGLVVYSFYCLEGESFDEIERMNIHKISELLFAYGGRARLGDMVSQLIMHDYLTGIPNLKHFLMHIGSVIASGEVQKYDAYYMNVKNFKYVNKIVQSGKGNNYSSGDAVMVQYARRLASFCEGNEMVARLGGDNYVAFILRERSARFREFISDIEISIMTDSGERLISLGVVAGIYEIPADIIQPSSVMMPISIAYQAAKQIHHKPFEYYTEELNRRILDGQKVLVDFMKCLSQGEFVPYFQPKFCVQDDSLCGAEALARWRHKGDLIPPLRFIPALERDGTICRLDFEMLKQTCDYVAKLLEDGRNPVRISVNFSRWNLKNPNLVQDVADVLNNYHVPPKYIEIELTETVDAEEYATLTRIVSEFKKLGVATSIDDFGTGYSSLNLLKDLDVDVLKMDQSFINEIGNENEGFKDRVLFTNVINMANALNMEVIAEGVETLEQKEFLKQSNCDMIQGFLYSKPLPMEEFDAMLI